MPAGNPQLNESPLKPAHTLPKLMTRPLRPALLRRAQNASVNEGPVSEMGWVLMSDCDAPLNNAALLSLPGTPALGQLPSVQENVLLPPELSTNVVLPLASSKRISVAGAVSSRKPVSSVRTTGTLKAHGLKP